MTIEPIEKRERAASLKGLHFLKWYVMSLGCWIVGEALVGTLAAVLLRVHFEKLFMPAAVWLLPPLLSLPLINYSWSLSERPRARALMFSLAVFVLFLMCLIAISYSCSKLFDPESTRYLIPVGIVGLLFSTIGAYFISNRSFNRATNMQQ
jgi:hypothetical protein